MLLCVFVVLLQLIIFTDCGNWKIFSIKGGKVYVNSEASNWPQGTHCLTGFPICNVVADNTPTISQMVFTLKMFYCQHAVRSLHAWMWIWTWVNCAGMLSVILAQQCQGNIPFRRHDESNQALVRVVSQSISKWIII